MHTARGASCGVGGGSGGPRAALSNRTPWCPLPPCRRFPCARLPTVGGPAVARAGPQARLREPAAATADHRLCAAVGPAGAARTSRRRWRPTASGGAPSTPGRATWTRVPPSSSATAMGPSSTPGSQTCGAARATRPPRPRALGSQSLSPCCAARDQHGRSPQARARPGTSQCGAVLCSAAGQGREMRPRRLEFPDGGAVPARRGRCRWRR